MRAMPIWKLLVSAGAWVVTAAAADPSVLSVQGVSIPLPLGLQADAAYVPDGNPPSPERVALGRLLYFDKRLSVDGTVSCATCHDPAHGFAEPRATSTGVGGEVGARNAPTVLNRLFSKEQFWDGRATDLEEQAQGTLRCSRRRSARPRSPCRASPRPSPPTSAGCSPATAPSTAIRRASGPR